MTKLQIKIRSLQACIGTFLSSSRLTRFGHKQVQWILALATVLVLSASLYAQYVLHLEPCPLCLMQRFCIMLLLIWMCVSLMLRNSYIVCAVQAVIAGCGLFFALRQLWLLSLPPEHTPACLPGLDVLLQYFPWQTVVHALFWGSGDCVESLWTFLGLSMPAWSALYFSTMFLVSLLLCTRRGR